MRSLVDPRKHVSRGGVNQNGPLGRACSSARHEMPRATRRIIGVDHFFGLAEQEDGPTGLVRSGLRGGLSINRSSRKLGDGNVRTETVEHERGAAAAAEDESH